MFWAIIVIMCFLFPIFLCFIIYIFWNFSSLLLWNIFHHPISRNSLDSHLTEFIKHEIIQFWLFTVFFFSGSVQHFTMCHILHHGSSCNEIKAILFSTFVPLSLLNNVHKGRYILGFCMFLVLWILNYFSKILFLKCGIWNKYELSLKY